MKTKTIPGFSRYKISSSGVVVNEGGKKLSGYDTNGYCRFSLINDEGKRVGIDCHRLVALAWIGPIPKGYWVNHEDGDKGNNHYKNLKIDTPGYNIRHARDKLGKKFGTPRKEDRREAIKLLLNNGWSQHKIGRAFGISQPAVNQLMNM